MFQFLVKLFLFIAASIFATVGTVLLPLLLFPIWCFFQLYKSIIVLIAKFRLPGATFLNSMSRVMALGNTNKLDHFYGTWCITIEGKISVESVRKAFQKVLDKKFADGRLKFPELQQYIRKFGGYSFWEWDKSFKLHEQVNIYNNNDEIVDKEKLILIRKKFHHKVFSKNKPIWDVLVVNNYRDNYFADEDKEYSVVLIKGQHAICDGISMSKLITDQLADNSKIPTNTNQRERQPTQMCKSLFTVVWVIILVVAYVHQYLFSLIYNRKRFFDRHPWHLPVSKNVRDHQLCVLHPIDKKLVKQIKDYHEVSIMSVLMVIVLGGMKRMMATKDLNLPRKLRVTFPIPKPNHPDYFTNHARGVELMAPFSPEDPIERLKKTDKNIKNALRGASPFFIDISVKVLGTFPYWIIRKLADDQIISVYFSSAPMTEPDSLFGGKMLAANYYITGTQSNGVLVGIAGFADSFNLTVQIDKYFLNNPSEVKCIEKHILEELDSLSKTMV